MINWFKNIYKKKSEKKQEEKTVNTAGWDCLFADISHWEPHFDVKKYNCKILINKCTDGTSFIDKTHAKRKKECEENGIIYGGYHFFQCDIDIIAQADHYIKTHGTFAMPPIVDFEKDKDQDEQALKRNLKNCLKMMKYIEKITGKTPIFYSYVGLLNSIRPDSDFKRFPLWIARYNKTLGPIPTPWDEKDVFAWQYGDGKNPAPYQNSYSGIGFCDGNIYNKENDVLRIL